ncbi:hypothetical protein MTR_1g082270 [Medicago truncatula]|uniref:Uncharacterized protein n=1 Tax=Medicago truncatula TaxID=3880 RepID=G7I7G3_MEDTR|nr:hypothetical protein MTR_1g082270 [Medicago truncatula]
MNHTKPIFYPIACKIPKMLTWMSMLVKDETDNKTPLNFWKKKKKLKSSSSSSIPRLESHGFFSNLTSQKSIFFIFLRFQPTN